MKNLQLSIPSMTCPHCKASVEAALNAVEGVIEASVELTTKVVSISCDDSIDVEALKAAVEEIGFDVVE